MSSEIIGTIAAAIISGIFVAVPTIVATVSSNKAHDAVVDEKMKNMSDQIGHVDLKIDKYSTNQDAIKERLVVVEQSTKSAHHRIDDVVQQLNIHERRE